MTQPQDRLQYMIWTRFFWEGALQTVKGVLTEDLYGQDLPSPWHIPRSETR